MPDLAANDEFPAACSRPIVLTHGGEGDIDETKRQLADFDVAAEVDAAWRPFVRVNFTLDG